MCVAVIGWFGAGSWQDTTYTYSILYPAVLVYVFMLGYYLYNVISKFVKKR